MEKGKFVMTTEEAKRELYEIINLKGRRKYIGKREVALLRRLIRSIEFQEKTKDELKAIFWDEYEVRG